LIGSDLVYDEKILTVLVPAVAAILKEGLIRLLYLLTFSGGHFLYVAPDFARAGMSDLVSSLAHHHIHCVDHSPAPQE
jgi:hypothetical protein